MGCAAFKSDISGRTSIVLDDDAESRRDSRSNVVSDTGSFPPSPRLFRKSSASKGKKLPTVDLSSGCGPSSQRLGTPRPPNDGTQSTDSGIYELDEGIITELSAPEKVMHVEKNFRHPEDVDDLVIEGKQCPRRLSGKEREKREEEEILDKLREEGLVVRPGSKASGGLSFEVSQSDTTRNSHHLPPLKKKKTKKTRKKEITSELIDQRLEQADARRKASWPLLS
ncbi:uncharacterized protein LOC135397470 [Ornithodoros turicata]|uniref:uncharacterized protein LOC135397470 n=1 Tax=Ornithodoros turicata TaxID=34597 RepID=UPI0031389BE5